MSVINDRAIFAALKALLAADSGGGGLATLVAASQFVRSDEPTTNRATPRIEVTIAPDPAAVTTLARIDMLLIVDDHEMPGTGDTPEASALLNTIQDRVLVVYDKVKPVLTGYTFGRCQLDQGWRPARPDEPERVARSIVFSVACGTSSQTIPLSGSDANLTDHGINFEVVEWRVDATPRKSTSDGTPLGSSVATTTIGDPLYRIQIDGYPTGTMPTYGTEVADVDFYYDSGASALTTDMQIAGWQWTARRGPGGRQILRVYANVNDQTTGFNG